MAKICNLIDIGKAVQKAKKKQRVILCFSLCVAEAGTTVLSRSALSFGRHQAGGSGLHVQVDFAFFEDYPLVEQ